MLLSKVRKTKDKRSLIGKYPVCKGGGIYKLLLINYLPMGILLWILFGALAGWLASIIMKSNAGQGTLSDIIMGVIGAVVGGFIMNLLGQSGVTGFNLYSIAVAVLGAIVVIYIGRMIRR
jgi:uncharacterized membrane protein YeaQ/YmgE (transglycosylase-associated protein family)